MKEVTAIPVWRAAHEFAGDALIVRASDYDALRAELTEQGLMVASESRRALRAERVCDELRAELAALSAPAAGQDVSALVDLLRESYTEFLTIKAAIGFRGNTIALIGRIGAALAAHKAGGES